MFNAKIFGTKKPSGQIELTSLTAEIATEIKENLFTKAVKEAASRDLTAQICRELNCIAYGTDRVEQTEKAKALADLGTPREKIKELFPLAAYEYGSYKLPSTYAHLAKQLANKWINDNY